MFNLNNQIGLTPGFQTQKAGVFVDHHYLSIRAGLWTALSTSKLFSSSTNSALLVRNSDGTTQNFGFVNDFIDDAGIAAFAPGGANLLTFYDQNGGGNDFSQGTTNLQPLYTAGGKSFYFNGLTVPYNKIVNAGLISNKNLTVFALFQQVGNVSGSILQKDSAGAFATFQYGAFDGTQQQNIYVGNGLFTSNFTGNNLVPGVYNLTMLNITAANAGTFYIKGVSPDTTFTTLYDTTFSPAIGGNDYRPFNGELKEMLIYTGALSVSDQTAVKNNIITRWSL
jgi:hypothetical protein